MQIDYRRRVEFCGARQLDGRWRGDNFELVVGSATPLSVDFLTTVVARYTHGEIRLGDQSPTTVNLGRALWVDLKRRLGEAAVDLRALELTEAAGDSVSVSPSQVEWIVRGAFSAAHRTHAPALSPAENAALFGKCNNLNGHGHNYLVEAAGPVGTSMAAELQAAAAALDHRNLSVDIAGLAGRNVVTETVAAWLAGRLPAANRVRVYETPDFYAEYRSGTSVVSLGRQYLFRAVQRSAGRLTGAAHAVWVRVGAPMDPVTETAYDLGRLDSVAAGILTPLDQTCLNDTPAVPRNRRPTLSNLALYLWDQFDAKLGPALHTLQLGASSVLSLTVTR